MRSRAALRAALLALIAERDFAQISVREIAARAGVTFPTFYRQFATKEALLSAIARDELSHMASLMSLRRGADNAAETAAAICGYVTDNRRLWSVLLTTGAAAVMRDRFVELTEEWAAGSERINPDMPADMVASFVISAIFDILGWWLRRPEGHPQARVARYLELLVLTPANSRHLIG